MVERAYGTGVPPVVHEFAYDTNTLALIAETIITGDRTNVLARSIDELGRPAGITMDSDYELTYAYDALGRFSSITSLVRRSFSEGGSVSSVVSPVFDNDGNMTEYGDWTFTWDGENRLIEVASNSVIVVENQYDYMSRRIMKATAAETNTYLYDGWNLLAETSTTDTNDYVWGLDLSQSMQGAGGVGGLLMTVLDGDPYFPAYDANGNITDYTDTTGTTVARYKFDPFGNVSAQTGPMADQFVYRFSTKYTDDETGLVYYVYRFYKPGLGRWINRDPIGERCGRNLFAIARNNLISRWDYLGFFDSPGLLPPPFPGTPDPRQTPIPPINNEGEWDWPGRREKTCTETMTISCGQSLVNVIIDAVFLAESAIQCTGANTGGSSADLWWWFPSPGDAALVTAGAGFASLVGDHTSGSGSEQILCAEGSVSVSATASFVMWVILTDVSLSWTENLAECDSVDECRCSE